jgi:TetR/AcrR family fatty acid metabolism transcriptional regulator
MAERKRRPAKASPALEKQRQIMEAAFEVFSRRGFSQATIAEIAQVAGVAEGTIYNYYRSKHDLLVALVHDYADREGISEILDRYSGAPGDVNLFRDLVENRVTVGFKNVDRLLVLIGEVQHDPELLQMYVEGMWQRALKRLEGSLKSGTEQGTFRQMDPAVAARTFLAMNMGLLIIYQLEGEGGVLRKTSPDRIAAEVAEVFLNGVQKK